MLTALAAVCALLGLLSAAVVLLRTRDLRLSVAVLLELLLAASLLRLAAGPAWGDLLVVAVVVVLRRVVLVASRHPAPVG